jgi:hypothetical protein
MGETCGIYWGEEIYFRTGFWWGSLKERGHLEYLDVDGKFTWRISVWFSQKQK